MKTSSKTTTGPSRQDIRDANLLAGTITEVNSLRSLLRLRGRPLKKLPTGYRGDSYNNPVANGLLSRIPITGATEITVITKTGGSKTVRTPHIHRFIAAFQTGRFSSLVS